MIILQHHDNEDRLDLYFNDVKHVYGFNNALVPELILKIEKETTLIGITKNAFYFDGHEKEYHAILHILDLYIYHNQLVAPKTERDILQERIETFLQGSFDQWLDEKATNHFRTRIQDWVESYMDYLEDQRASEGEFEIEE